ncbi:hypothetical protein BDV93DRAFT_523664 [Ceratobasidium sp. AG-I]|nr:hypothetical protein BDV93DRAFT_523664 [Ceratobasidium sp. AG-I]
MNTLRSLPEELTLQVGHSCPRPDLKSMLLASHYYYQRLIPILYKNVHLGNLENLNRFHHTICTLRASFGVYPEAIHIKLRFSQINRHSIAPLIHEILASTPRLLDLSLRFPASIIPEVLHGSPHQFLLKSLTIRPTSDETFMNFLRHQPQIEILHLIDPIPRDYHFDMRELEPTMLPNLQVVSGWSPSLLYLVPGRPISTIHDKSACLPSSLPEFGALLAQSSASLTSLNIALLQSLFPLHDGVDVLLFNIRHLLSTLKHLTLNFLAPRTREYQTVSISKWLEDVEQARQEFRHTRQKLSDFTLNTFHLRCDVLQATLTPDFHQTVPELSQFHLWKSACPSLEYISILGVEMYDS